MFSAFRAIPWAASGSIRRISAMPIRSSISDLQIRKHVRAIHQWQGL